jgi:hypothetical protein
LRQSFNGATRKDDPSATSQHLSWSRELISRRISTTYSTSAYDSAEVFYCQKSGWAILETLIQNLQDQFIQRPSSCRSEFEELLFNGR